MGRVRRVNPIARTVGAAIGFGLLLFCPATADISVAHKRVPSVVQHPSIVLILTDDQPAGTLWAMPRTKRLLAGHGVKFTSFYDSVSMCCPARATLLTGRYAHSTSVYANNPPSGGSGTFRSRGDDQETLAVWLHRAGYRTALFGKYLNGYKGGFVPPGWDRFATSTRYWGGVGYVQGVKKEFPATTYMPRFMGAKTSQFIRSTPRGVPLFAYYAPFAPHGRPYPERRFAHMPVCPHCHGWPSPAFDERNMSDKPPFERRGPFTLAQRQAVHRFRRLQIRTLQSVDGAVKRIVAALRDTGRLQNTIVVFMSDNGVMWGAHRWPAGAKSNPYNESSRVPLIIRYDRLGTRPRVDPRLVGNVDIAPTLADLAGVQAAQSVDGASFARILRDPSTPWSRTLLIEHMFRPRTHTGHGPSYCGVRTDRYLFVRYATRFEELYDERLDPFELRNIAGKPSAAPVRDKLRQKTRRLCTPEPPGFRF
jgi:N-acetylglucosamine-6-sulfatase